MGVKFFVYAGVFGFVCLVSSFGLSGEAKAYNCNNGACSNVIIDHVYVNPDSVAGAGVIYIGTTGDESLNGCTEISSELGVEVHMDEDLADQAFAFIMTAYLQKIPVDIRMGTSGTCTMWWIGTGD